MTKPCVRNITITITIALQVMEVGAGVHLLRPADPPNFARIRSRASSCSLRCRAT
jgi:hypothetical protein